jgi:glycosyltransferase 2 family protein
MHDVTSLPAQSSRTRNGWHKIGIVISLVIVAAAGIVLFYLLRDIDLPKVLDAIRAKPPHAIAFAAAFIGCCYVTLTFYDFFSLHTIGHGRVPYRIAALASFTSYSIGHNLGATVFTAGAVRWRIYSSWGLSVIDVAKMAFVTGLTFWLGNIVVLALCFMIEPEAASAVDQLPQWINRSLGVAGFVIIAGYVLWLVPRPRTIGRNGWSVTLPNAPLTGVQIAIGLVDLTVGGLAIYSLLPAVPAVDFVTVLVIFVTAVLLGFLSHAPGSLGVFEVAILVALPQFSKEELLASLLIFRVLYFVLPLCVAVCLLATRELVLAMRK